MKKYAAYVEFDAYQADHDHCFDQVARDACREVCRKLTIK